jgi:RNA polymerase sigma-70 factor (ECF subfamily)
MDETKDSDDEMQAISAILAGDLQFFHQLIRPYERTVYMMVIAILHNEADAEDATQETFLKAFRGLKGFRGDAKFGTWLVSIALNEAKGRLRQRKGVTMESLDEPPDERGHFAPALLRDWREIPSESVERQEVRSMLQEAVVGLPLIYREVFLLRTLEELSVAEAAQTLGITVASVKVRLHRARLMLQKKLAPQLKHIDRKRRWFPW